ncbi:PIN domain-like protein [Mycena polygramma]|nr:PIN domain-like protein [Mycena polygramma]
MGIPRLFEVLDKAAERRNLLQFALEKAFEDGAHHCRPLIMGVDASIWMYQAERTARHRRSVHAGPNPVLRTLFYKLANLLALPVCVVFAFDGRAPDIKRGVRVSQRDHSCMAPFQELIRAFGYHVHMAPGEAEAELAYLNQAGAIDVVQTNDSDVFVFGASAVFTIPNKKLDGNHATLYTLENFFVSPDVSLTRGGLLLVALLAGGDYHPGIPGCGVAIAHAISRSHLGDDLLAAASQHPYLTDRLIDFLTSWRRALHSEFATDSHGYLGRRHPRIAARIEASFPDIDVLFAYVHPTTSWSNGYHLPDYHRCAVPYPLLVNTAYFIVASRR